MKHAIHTIDLTPYFLHKSVIISFYYTFIITFMFQPVQGPRGQAHFTMRQPGALHHARFMAKSIYLLKMYLLSDTFPMVRREKANVSRLAKFVFLLYGKYFLTTPLSTAAPRNDIEFWYDLQKYRAVDMEVGDAALVSARRHLWYLTPELVVLALFDADLPDDEKKLMAQTLSHIPKPAAFIPGKPGQPAVNPVAASLTEIKPNLATFISSRSWLIFHLIDAETQWLREEPSTWHTNATYLFLCDFVWTYKS